MGRVIMMCVGLIVTIFAGANLMLAGTRHPYRDPFAEYETIRPGQLAINLDHYPCFLYRDESSTAHCDFTLKRGPVESVKVTYDRTVKWILFTFRPDNVRLGDLVLSWGKPTRIDSTYPSTVSSWIIVHWGSQRYAMIAIGQYFARPDYQTPVAYVVMTHNAQ